ncbi:MAG: hypothetical protein IT377_16770 [Polyangiaceae bacterium]|nr:hypothetical protein [Polyangiaceae bacterium]
MARLLPVALLALGLLVPQAALAAGIPIEKASKEQLKAAQRTFEAADGLFDAKRYKEAITAYRASNEIVASPNSRLMIARSLAALGQLDDAYYELVGAVNDAKSAAAADSKYAPTLKAAEAELAAMEPKVGRVELVLAASAKDAKVNVGPRTIAILDLDKPVVVTPGNIVVVAALPDGRSVRKEVSVAAGATEKVELDIPADASAAPPPQAAPTAPAPTPSDPGPTPHKGSSLRPIAYVAGGVGVAGFATFAIFGLMNKSKFDDLESRCSEGHCGPDGQSDIDAGRRYQTIANIGLAVGILGVGTGATLFLLSGDKKQPEKSAALRVHVAPGYAALGGRF